MKTARVPDAANGFSGSLRHGPQACHAITIRAERRWSDARASWHKILVKNQEPICAGLIAGGALMGISAMLEAV